MSCFYMKNLDGSAIRVYNKYTRMGYILSYDGKEKLCRKRNAVAAVKS